MAIEKILFVLILVTTNIPAYSKYVSSWNQKDFLDYSGEKQTAEMDLKNYKVCETEECKSIAEEFLSGMNKSVNPCDNFYKFACGAWSATNPIPPSKLSWHRRAVFESAIQYRIKGLLEAELVPSDILPMRQAKKWYRSCMDIENLERKGLEPIETILLQTGGWPIIMDYDEWNPEDYPWQYVERHYASLTGSYTLYNVKLYPLSGQLEVYGPDTPFGNHEVLKYRSYSGRDYKIYLRLVKEVVNLFLQENRIKMLKEKIDREAQEIVEFEKKLYKLMQKGGRGSWTYAEFVNSYITNTTAIKYYTNAQINWKSVIQGFFNMVNAKIKPSMKIFTKEFRYIREIGNLLRKTPSRTIVNYIHWNFVATMVPYTTEEARNILFKLLKDEYGAKQRAPRWSECVNDMKMSHAPAYVFVNKYFTNSTESVARKIIRNVQIGMEYQIKKSNWLDKKSKAWAEEKLKEMKMLIGFPDWYKNETAVVNRYKGLTIGTEYFDNILSYMRYDVKKQLKRIFGSATETYDMWSFIDPVTMNAIYTRFINTLAVPAAHFQTPFFTTQFPNNVNYAYAGFIVGHEMGHGFDNKGILYGKHSTGRKLSKATIKNYNQRTACFRDQFNEYFGDDFGPSEMSMGMRTQAENIADTMGIQSAFIAYKKVAKNLKHGETRLPGLEEFTDDQLFFLSFATMWCKVKRPEYARREREFKHTHSPPKFRIIGSLSNTKDFAKVFQCPKGSPMNPRNKCSIWEKPEVTSKTQLGGGSIKREHLRWGAKRKI